MRTRLILAFILVAAISIASMFIALRLSAAREVHTFMYRGGMVGLDDLVAELEDYYRQTGSWKGLSLPLANGMGKGHGMGGMMGQRLRLYDAAGKQVVDSAGGGAASLQESDRRQAIQLLVDGKTVGYLLPEGGMVLPDQEARLLYRLSNAALVSALIASGISILLAILLAYGLLRPVHDLTHAATQMASGNLGVRVSAHGPAEMASLGAAFNHLAASLQQAEEARRAMTADIAHELRTPLAVQRAALEALQDGVYPPTPENLQSLLEQNQLLTRLVEDLRTLALADAGQLKLECTPTDLSALIQRLIARFAPQALAHSVELVFNPPPFPLPLLSLDPSRLEQILNNLLTNAFRYTPAGGKIECSIAALEYPPGQAALSVTIRDTGPGIPPAALPHIFERFYRADPSRNRAEGGSGLGLTIARQLAEAHGGTLTADNHPQGGAVFTLILPVRPR